MGAGVGGGGVGLCCVDSERFCLACEGSGLCGLLWLVGWVWRRGSREEGVRRVFFA